MQLSYANVLCADDNLSTECSENLIKCIDKFKRSGEPKFTGNTCLVEDVAKLITLVIDAALLATRYLHKP
ncbi:hypothetical protein HYC85_026211 [Camellia sinensis]|uniref:Pectinesterase inhibitor domain-containing protein n=1 Tax=Camellia sinensis TaxID=4442 RepID=A0A7J7G317_CAMSI|nr:hypothetical protein HYC85_026211 [Camellia sinensis]